MPKPRPVTIRGVTYASTNEAAAALGVSYSAVTEAKRRGKLDHVGLGSSTLSKPVRIGNISFPSRKAASDALGAGKAYVSEVFNNPTEKRMRGFAQRLARYAKENGIET